MTVDPAVDEVATASPRGSGAAAAGRPRDERRLRLAAALFPSAAPVTMTWVRLIWAGIALCVGTAVGLSRLRGPGALDTLWAEDGGALLNDALNLPFWKAVTAPLNGYYIIGPRLVGALIAALPLGGAAAAMSVVAAVLSTLIALTVYVASRGHLPDPLMRLVVAAPVIVPPVGQLFVPHHVVTLQFIALYATFWVLMWSPPGWSRRSAGLAVVLITGLSTILAVTLIPLAVGRVVLRRDRYSWLLLGTLGAMAALQMSGAAARSAVSTPRLDPIWALVNYVIYGVPYSIVGERWLEPPVPGENGVWQVLPPPHHAEQAALAVAAWVVVMVAVLAAVRRLTNPSWALAIVAGGHAVWIFAFEVMGYGYGYHERYVIHERILVITDRYLVVPALLLIVVMVALLNPSGPLRRRLSTWPANAWPLLCYTTLLLVVCLVNLRPDNVRSMSAPWRGLVHHAAQQCARTGAEHVAVLSGSPDWALGWPTVNLPCRRLR